MIIKPSSVSRVLEFDGSGTLTGAKYYSEGNVLFAVRSVYGGFALDDYLFNETRRSNREMPMPVAVRASSAFIRKHLGIEVVDIEPAAEGGNVDVVA